MPWKKVVSYSFGFSETNKKFWLYYTLQGSGTVTQVFVTAAQFNAIAAMFASATSIDYETSANYFATAPRTL